MAENSDKRLWETTVEERDRLRCVVVRVATVESFHVLHHEMVSPNGFTVDGELDLPMGSRLPLYVEPPAGEEPVKIPATVLFATPRQTIVSLQLDHPRVARRWRELEEDFGIVDEAEPAVPQGPVSEPEPEPEPPPEPEPEPEPAAEPVNLLRPTESKIAMPSLSHVRGHTDEFLGALVPSLDLSASASPSEPAAQPPTEAPAKPAAARGGFTSRVKATAETPKAPIRKRRDVVRRPRRFGPKTEEAAVPKVTDAAEPEATPTPPPKPSRPGIRKGAAARRREEREE